MRIKASIKKICNNCKLTKRGGHLYIICKKNPKHKQRQG